MEFQHTDDRKKLDPIIAAFETFCAGAVNVMYERYVFNLRTQENGERFETFLGKVCQLARSCDFGTVEESTIQDRIIVSIHDESTRRKLLQVCDLSLAKAVDICKGSEAADRQLKALSMTDHVQAPHSSKWSGAHGRGRDRDKSKNLPPLADSEHRCKNSSARRC